jgi:formate hydrogenlyase transcriptional activator
VVQVADLGRDDLSVAEATLAILRRHSWPGNIRELQNLVERSVILSPGPVLHIPVPDAVPDSGNVRWTLPVSKDENPERERILDVMRVSSGEIGGPEGAAARLGLRRTTLQSRMKKLGIARHFR